MSLFSRLIHPSRSFRALYETMPMKLSIAWYLLAMVVGIGLFFSLSPVSVSIDFSLSNLRFYVAWPPLGPSVVIITTLVCACLFLNYAFPGINDITIKLASFAGLLAFFSLAVIGQFEQSDVFGELIAPSDPILHASIGLLLLAFFVAFSVSTSLYVAASDTRAASLENRHILGILSSIIVLGGILFLIHKLGLLGLSFLTGRNSEILQLGFTIMMVVAFGCYVIILLRATTKHAIDNRLSGVGILAGFHILNLVPSFVSLSIMWLISSTVFTGISGGGTWIAWAGGLLLAITAFSVIGFVFLMFALVGLYDSGGPILRLFWTVRIETILEDSFRLETAQQFQSFYQTTLAQAKKSTKSHAKLMERLSNLLCDLYSSDSDKAVSILAQLPAYTAIGDDDLWIPVLNGILSSPQNDYAEIIDSLFGKFSKAGLLERVSPLLTSISLFDSYYQLTTVDEAGFEKALENALKCLMTFPKFHDLLQTYTILGRYNSLSTFKDIAYLSTENATKINFHQNAVTSRLEKPLNTFPVIVNNARKSEQVALEHKLPYFANSFELLNSIIDDADKLPQPHQRTVTLVSRKWQSILTTELMSLKGRAELNVELKSRRFYYYEKLVIPIEIHNTGNSVAENIRIELVSDGRQFKVLDFDFNELDILAPDESVIVNFAIAPLSLGKIRIAIETTFTDFDASGKVHKFGNIIEVVGKDQNSIEDERDYGAFLNNPYIPGRPIRTSQMFFGRQDVLATIEQSLRGRHQDNVIVLQGERRSGKTSILYYLLRKFRDDYVPVLIDAQGILSRGTEYFIWQFASIIQEQLQESNFIVPPPDPEIAMQKAEVWLRYQFLANVRSVLNGRKLLILFDEFDSLEERIREGDLDKEIFPLFRNLMQHEDWLAFIFSGTHRLEEMVTEYWSILFNIAIYVRLEFLSEQDARRLITEPVSGALEFDEFAIERILAVSSQHPYFVQLICFLLYNLHVREGNSYITSQDVDRIIDEVIDTQAHTHFIWKDTSRNEHFVLGALAQEAKQENGVVTPIMIRSILGEHNVNMSQIDINDALTRLSRKGILSSDNTVTQFRFRVELIRRWLRRYKSLSSVIDEEGR